MSQRAPEPAIRHPLEDQHRRHRLAWMWRCALRGAERCAVLVAVALLLGVAFAPGVATAWLRLLALSVAAGLAIVGMAGRFGRNVLSLPTYLERVEERSLEADGVSSRRQ